MFEVSISKEQVNKMQSVAFPGHIHVVDAVSLVKVAVESLRKAPLVGFDTETRPAFKRGEHHKIALLQLSTPTDAFLIRLNKTGMTRDLKNYLEDAGCIKVGLSTNDDFHQLRGISDVNPRGFVELQSLARQNKISDMGLQKIYAILFNQKINKSQQLSNWEAPKLTEAQKSYAAIDAWACIQIYERLRDGRFIPEQSAYWNEVATDGQIAG